MHIFTIPCRVSMYRPMQRVCTVRCTLIYAPPPARLRAVRANSTRPQRVVDGGRAQPISVSCLSDIGVSSVAPTRSHPPTGSGNQTARKAGTHRPQVDPEAKRGRPRRHGGGRCAEARRRQIARRLFDAYFITCLFAVCYFIGGKGRRSRAAPLK